MWTDLQQWLDAHPWVATLLATITVPVGAVLVQPWRNMVRIKRIEDTIQSDRTEIMNLLEQMRGEQRENARSVDARFGHIEQQLEGVRQGFTAHLDKR